MKRYLTALFIPWMFFFLAGCYSTRFLTYDELKDQESDKNDVLVVSTKRQQYILVSSEKNNMNKPGCLYCNKWEVFNDSIKMTCLNLAQVVPEQEIYTLSKPDIATISTEEFDTVSTIFLIVIPTLIMTGMIIVFKNNPPGWGGHNSGYSGN